MTTKLKIKIAAENAEKIEAVLQAVNGRATAHAITTYADVERVANRSEKRLEHVPLKQRSGSVATYTPAGPTTKSYRYAAKTTTITITRGSSGWFLVAVDATRVFPCRAEAYTLVLTSAQAQYIVDAALNNVCVTDEYSRKYADYDNASKMLCLVTERAMIETRLDKINAQLSRL